VEVVSGDILERASLARSFRDIDVAYYLIHSDSVTTRAGRCHRTWQVGTRSAGCSPRGRCR
jgi:hypothetical protein